MKYPNFLIVAAKHRDPTWVYFHFWASQDRVNLDQWLVQVKHPLAYTAGTNEYRFRRIIAEIKEHENGRNQDRQTENEPEVLLLRDYA